MAASSFDDDFFDRIERIVVQLGEDKDIWYSLGDLGRLDAHLHLHLPLRPTTFAASDGTSTTHHASIPSWLPTPSPTHVEAIADMMRQRRVAAETATIPSSVLSPPSLFRGPKFFARNEPSFRTPFSWASMLTNIGIALSYSDVENAFEDISGSSSGSGSGRFVPGPRCRLLRGDDGLEVMIEKGQCCSGGPFRGWPSDPPMPRRLRADEGNRAASDEEINLPCWRGFGFLESDYDERLTGCIMGDASFAVQFDDYEDELEPDMPGRRDGLDSGGRGHGDMYRGNAPRVLRSELHCTLPLLLWKVCERAEKGKVGKDCFAEAIVVRLFSPSSLFSLLSSVFPPPSLPLSPPPFPLTLFSLKRTKPTRPSN